MLLQQAPESGAEGRVLEFELEVAVRSNAGNGCLSGRWYRYITSGSMVECGTY